MIPPNATSTIESDIACMEESLARDGVPLVLRLKDAAAILQISPTTASEWAREGRLLAYRIGSGQGVWRINRADLAATIMTLPRVCDPLPF